jgi:hypothetical protein
VLSELIRQQLTVYAQAHEATLRLSNKTELWLFLPYTTSKPQANNSEAGGAHTGQPEAVLKRMLFLLYFR